MWLLPWLSGLARFLMRVYFRVRYVGDDIPKRGPVLVVANHPNSLMDPALVAAAAGRPIRFLAKATLFTDAKLGWLVRAAGSIPVYRRVDDPTQMARNAETFAAVRAALARGDAIALFPEGISHNAPSMAPLKTGAARIALGAAQEIGGAFPIVPVGLVFDKKSVFRSDALVYRGQPISWTDLSMRGSEDADAVTALTDRIAAALHDVTVNLERLEDRPLVDFAVRIWEAEHGAIPAPSERLARLGITTDLLSAVRERSDAEGLDLAREVQAHRRRLAVLGLRPADLTADVRLATGVRWALRRLPVLLPVSYVFGVASALLFWIPYRLTGAIVDRLHLELDVQSIWKLLLGVVLYVAWLIAISVAAGVRYGFAGAVTAFIGVSVVGLIGLGVREEVRRSWSDVRRFSLLRSREELMAGLRGRQRELGKRLEALHRRFLPGQPEAVGQ